MPGEIVHRAGERPLHVAEEFALDQMLRQRGAVELDQRSGRASAAGVDEVGHDLLADAALAGDEDIGFRRRDLGDELLDLDHAPVLEHRSQSRLGLA